MTTKDPPTIQQFDSFYYVIAGDAFTLNCIATDDPQSPDELKFTWYQDNHNITNLATVNASKPNYTSQLRIEKLDSDQHSGQYSCVAYNAASISVSSNTTVIVES